MEHFKNYTKHNQDDKHFKTSFDLYGCPLYIANSMRRSFSSNIPTVTFSDTYYDNPQDRSINIKTNTSALHNEFLSHRISLLPICMELPGIMSIDTKLDKTGTRRFLFSDETTVPLFTLNIKNNIEQESNRDKHGLIEVTTDHFKTDTTEQDYTIDQYFPYDVFTKTPILINKLKYNISDPDEGDELDIICTPTIGQGKENARYDPTGTVTFSYKVDDSRIQEVLEKKIKYLNNERVSKGLDEFNNEELAQLERSFNLLDKNRVFHKDSRGNPSIFEFSIESIGFLNPDQIIFDGMSMLYLQLRDIINCIDVSFLDSINNIKPKEIAFSHNKRLEIQDIENSENIGVNINIKGENHTIGNLISSTIRSYFCGNDAIEKNLLTIASYKMQHPTIEEIDVVIVPNRDITKEKYLDYIYNLVNQDELFINKEVFRDALLTTDLEFIRKLFCTMLFVRALYSASNEINNILSEFKNLSKIETTSFTVKDQPSYYTKNNWCTNYLSSDMNGNLLDSTKPAFL